MAGAITPSFQFQGSPNTYTHTQFNDWLSNATIAGIDRSNFASTTRPVTVSASAPSTPQAGELWYDTGETILKIYDGASWSGIGPGPEQIVEAAGTISASDVVVSTSLTGPQASSSVDQPTVLGVAKNAVTSGQDLRLQTTGVCTVKCDSSAVGIGNYLITSSTAGRAEAAAESEQNRFAIALSSKSGGSTGTVQAILLGGQAVRLGYVQSTFSTYTLTGASLTSGTWYDVPSAALGSFVTTDGTSRLKATIITTRPSQPVTVSITDVRMVSNDTAKPIHGVRLVLGTNTVITTASTKGTTADLTPNATGEEEHVGLGSVIYQKGSSYELAVLGLSVTFLVAVAGSTTIGIQFLAGATASYTTTSSTTATLTAVLH